MTRLAMFLGALMITACVSVPADAAVANRRLAKSSVAGDFTNLRLRTFYATRVIGIQF